MAVRLTDAPLGLPVDGVGAAQHLEAAVDVADVEPGAEGDVVFEIVELLLVLECGQRGGRSVGGAAVVTVGHPERLRVARLAGGVAGVADPGPRRRTLLRHAAVGGGHRQRQPVHEDARAVGGVGELVGGGGGGEQQAGVGRHLQSAAAVSRGAAERAARHAAAARRRLQGRAAELSAALRQLERHVPGLHLHLHLQQQQQQQQQRQRRLIRSDHSSP